MFASRCIIFIWIFLAQLQSGADGVGIVYVKNNGPAATVWINNTLQGIVPAGRTCYTVVEGFVTNDSGFQADGRLVLKDSHAGWPRSTSLKFLAIATEQVEGEFVNKYWTGTFSDEQKELWLWIGGEPKITSLDCENSFQIQKTGGNYTAKADVAKGGEPDDNESSYGGELKSGTSLPTMATGGGITITSPASGFATEQRIASLRGTVKDPAIKSVVLSINGRDQIVPVSSGAFSATISLTVGENKVVARSNKGSAKSRPIVVNCTDAPSELWVELVWDGYGDVDLHTTQPNGQDVAYNNKYPSGGGQLDVDNTKGFGPEHYFISAARGDTVFRGKYAIWLEHYSGDVPVNWTVTVFKNERHFGTYRGRLNGAKQSASVVAVEF